MYVHIHILSSVIPQYISIYAAQISFFNDRKSTYLSMCYMLAVEIFASTSVPDSLVKMESVDIALFLAGFQKNYTAKWYVRL